MAFHLEHFPYQPLKKYIMKKAIRILGLFLLVFFAVTSFSSCSDDDDPANNDFFAGTYRGSISYNDSDNDISTDNGSVFVTKIASGTKYNFAFSNGIPDLNGVEFNQEGDHTLVMVGSTATSYIRIDNNELKILYLKDGRTWTANCTR
jgi:hypothetical protein